MKQVWLDLWSETKIQGMVKKKRERERERETGKRKKRSRETEVRETKLNFVSKA